MREIYCKVNEAPGRKDDIMTTNEAIKKIQYVIDDYPEIYSKEVLDALRLGIEALKSRVITGGK